MSLYTQDLGNNESRVRGIARINDGQYLALTFAQSKTFKTEAGATRWLARRGINPDGTRIAD